EVDRHAFAVAQIREVAEALQRRHVLDLLLADAVELAAVDERVLHLLECADDGLLVGVERLLLDRLGAAGLACDPACVEDRLQQARTYRPALRRSLEQVGELRTLESEK